MSCMSPAPASVHPLALLTSRVGSNSFTHAAIRFVPSVPYGSVCPHPSLNGTHVTIDGELMCCSTSAFISTSNCFCHAPDLGASALGMSCHTSNPSLSAQ